MTASDGATCTQPGRAETPRSERKLLAGALALAAGAVAGAYILGARRAVAGSAPRPTPRTALQRLRRPASPAALDGTPRRRLYGGRDLARAVAIEDLRLMAHRRLPAVALEYLEGGAEQEAALARNLEAFANWYFVPRALVDVSCRNLATNLFGRRTEMPIAIAPSGLNSLLWPRGDLALAEAAADAGIPFIQSTMSNDRMERVAAVPGLRHWWQLYVFGESSIWTSLIDRAKRVGCEALVVTTDAQIYGNREWDSRNRDAQREDLTWGSYANAALHPRWLASMVAQRGMPSFSNVIEYVPENRRSFFDSAFWIRSQMDQTISWETLGIIRDLWPRKLLVKGLLHVDDIARAAEMGVDGVVISNHGGRQLDWSVSALDVLQGAREAAGERLTIIFDGGIRRGTDVLKALALGADAVLVGRAALYGLAAAGRPGVARALAILQDELERNLGLIGATHVQSVGPEVLARLGSGSSGR